MAVYQNEQESIDIVAARAVRAGRIFAKMAKADDLEIDLQWLRSHEPIITRLANLEALNAEDEDSLDKIEGALRYALDEIQPGRGRICATGEDEDLPFLDPGAEGLRCLVSQLVAFRRDRNAVLDMAGAEQALRKIGVR